MRTGPVDSLRVESVEQLRFMVTVGYGLDRKNIAFDSVLWKQFVEGKGTPHPGAALWREIVTDKQDAFLAQSFSPARLFMIFTCFATFFSKIASLLTRSKLLLLISS